MPTNSWFAFEEWPHKYRCFLGVVPSLVSINTNDPDVRQHICDSATYWIKEFGFDGFRIDHVIGHGIDFWVQLRQAVEEANPEAVLIGEVTDTPDAIRHYRGRLHSILDFPLAQAFRHESFPPCSW